MAHSITCPTNQRIIPNLMKVFEAINHAPGQWEEFLPYNIQKKKCLVNAWRGRNGSVTRK